MIEPLVLYGQAATLFENGSVKEAYSTFLTVIETATQSLHTVKFTSHMAISRPTGCLQSLSLIRSSLARIEEITLGRPLSLPRSPQLSIFTPESTEEDLSPTDSERLPPAVPPKPIDMQRKPSIPPKPPVLDTARPVSSLSSGRNRSRGNSVSFATTQTPPTPPPRRPHPHPQASSESSLLLSDMEIIRTALETDGNTRLNSQTIDIFADSVVDPSILVPARTDSGDSMALPSTESPLESIPRIPALPLLITHTILQFQIDHPQTHEIMNKQDMIIKVRNLYMSAATIPDLMQFAPHLVAYQLTLIDSAIFRAIPSQALLSHSPKSPHPRIVASTDFFNYFTRAIEHSILLPQEASRRAELVNRWIKIASHCLNLTNFQTLKAIISALHSPPVSRLRRTWECIPKKRMQRLAFLHQLMSEANNYEAYRHHMGETRWNKPVVPFLGIFLHDITYLLAATKDMNEDPRIQDLLSIFQDFIALPPYSQTPPPAYVKASKKHSFRPGSFTNAIYSRSSSSTSSTLSFGKQNTGQSDDELGKDQQLITQYILMRSWVTQPIIDELSQLREPPKNPRPQSHHRSSSQSSSTNGHSLFSLGMSQNQPNPASSNGSPLRLTPTTSTQSEDDGRKNSGGFWPFHRKSDLRHNDLSTEIWSEDDEFDDDELDDEQTDLVKIQSSVSMSQSIKRMSGHSRSFSLPSVRSNILPNK